MRAARPADIGGRATLASPFAAPPPADRVRALTRRVQGGAGVSDTDSFIREVTEEVRQDRLIGYWKRYGPFVIGGIILIVGAAALVTWLGKRARQEAEARGAAFITADAASPEARDALVGQLDGLSAELALLRIAAAQAAEGETAAAVETYTRVAEGALSAPYRDFAALQAIRLAAPGLPPAEAADRLAALAEGDGPYRMLALEFRAVLRLNAGDRAGARADLETILASETVPEGLRARAGQLLAIIGEDDDAAG